jgi:hypothetical protein
LLTFLLVLLGGCTLPHTRTYQPVSPWEKQVFTRANRNVFPDDIRNDLFRSHDALVAWPGVVLASEFVDHEDGIEIQFLLEHHYYHWIEDFSIQRERVFLSPRGEGQRCGRLRAREASSSSMESQSESTKTERSA